MIQTCMFMQGLHTSKTDLIHTLIWQGLQHHQHRTSFTVTYCTSNTWYLLHTRPVAHERPVRRDTDLCSIAHLMRTVNVADILGVPSPLCVHECHVPGSEIWNLLAFSMKDWHQNARHVESRHVVSLKMFPFTGLFVHFLDWNIYVLGQWRGWKVWLMTLRILLCHVFCYLAILVLLVTHSCNIWIIQSDLAARTVCRIK